MLSHFYVKCWINFFNEDQVIIFAYVSMISCPILIPEIHGKFAFWKYRVTVALVGLLLLLKHYQTVFASILAW